MPIPILRSFTMSPDATFGQTQRVDASIGIGRRPYDAGVGTGGVPARLTIAPRTDGALSTAIEVFQPDTHAVLRVRQSTNEMYDSFTLSATGMDWGSGQADPDVYLRRVVRDRFIGGSGAFAQRLQTGGLLGLRTSAPTGFGSLVYLDSDTANRIRWRDVDVGVPRQQTTDGDVLHAKAVWYSGYATGVESGHLWHLAAQGHKLYTHNDMGNMPGKAEAVFGINGHRLYRSTAVRNHLDEAYLVLNPGNAGNSGYIAWHRADGTRKAFMGWGSSSNSGPMGIPTAIECAVEDGGTFSIHNSFNGNRDTLCVTQHGNNGHTLLRTRLFAGNGFHTYGDRADVGGNTWYVNASAEIRATNYANMSDGMMKQNVRTFATVHNPLTFLRKLRPVTFEWLAGVGVTGEHFGFVAQEVQTAAPELVQTEELPPGETREPTLALRTMEMIAPIVAAIQVLADRLDALEARLPA